jgi:hypothetical protein
MAGRIGNVLYWLGCIIAGLIALAGVYVYIMEGHGRSDGLVVTAGFFVAAFVVWLFGRAALYIFAAR